MAEIVKIFGKKGWIESDILGARHVMVQHDAPGEDPFCYASFNYDYRHTCNSGTMGEAKRLAWALGAPEAVEHRHRELPSMSQSVATESKATQRKDGE